MTHLNYDVEELEVEEIELEGWHIVDVEEFLAECKELEAAALEEINLEEIEEDTLEPMTDAERWDAMAESMFTMRGTY